MTGVTLLIAVLFSIATQSYPVSHVEAASLTPDELQAMAMAEATAHHLNIRKFLATINCESQWVPDAQSKYIKPDGTRENSWGLVQINLDAHDITKEEANDPQFALQWMAEQWSMGNAHIWTCYRTL